MPTYTYHCESCGVRFDQYQKFTDEPLTLCPECGEIALRKVFQPVGIVFKGSGFYSTDHRSPSGQTHLTGKSESNDEGKMEHKQSDETKSDSTKSESPTNSEKPKPVAKTES
jgi:putative FmdB family regulatory protein